MDISNNSKAVIELFHLLFMEQLSQKLDKRLYALKGGCNLRFFFGSIRYSEDIDLDIHTVAPTTLENTVNKILAGIVFTQLLKTKNISILHFSTPKQTATTQRWKIQLTLPNHTLPINTKIEFSRRDSTQGSVSEIIVRELMIAYKLRPLFISHYPAAIALQQKISALILRTETQARDVFDIYHLMQTNKLEITAFTTEELQIAIDNAMSIDFAAFKAQVVSYLEPDYQAQYDDADRWNQMLLTVCDELRCTP